MVTEFILVASIVLNAVAVGFAVRLMPITGRPVGWLLLSLAFVFMLLHSATELWTGGEALRFQAVHQRLELFEFVVAIAVVLGMWQIRRSFLEREEARRLLERSEAQWSDTFDAIARPIFLHDAEFHVVRANRAYLEQAGKLLEQVVGRPYWLSFPPRDGPLPGCAKALAEESSATEELCLADGRLFTSRSFVMPAHSGVCTYAVHVLEDVTEQRRQEQERRALGEALKQAAVALILTDAERMVTWVNPAFERLFGYTEAEIRGRSLAVLLPTPAHGAAPSQAAIAETARREGVWTGEVLRRRADGTLIPVMVTAAGVFDEAGRLRGFVGSLMDLRPLKQAQADLERSEQRYRRLVDEAPIGIAVLDEDGRFQFVNRALARIIGFTSKQLRGRELVEFFPPARRDEERQRLHAHAQSRQALAPMELPLERPDGERRYVQLQANPYSVNNTKGLQLLLLDLTERRQAEQALAEREAHFRTLFERSLNPIMVVDDAGHYVDANDAALKFLERGREAVLGRTVFDFSPPERRVQDEQVHRPVWETGGVVETEFWINGKSKFLELSISPTVRNGRRVVFGIGTDITDRKRYERTLAHRAQYDPLTELPNRSLLSDRLQQAILQSKRTGRLVAVLFLDLDQFKIVNETLGHEVGDKLLVAVAQRLTGCIREGDTAGRYGGDEFVIILPNLQHAEDIFFVTDKVLMRVSASVRIEQQILHTTVSIGVSLYPRDGEAATVLLRNADAALYRAKAAGGNGLQFYTAALNTEVVERLMLGRELRRALDENQFRIYFQPQVDLESGAIRSLEALVRWPHPELGWIDPTRFIPFAEESGLIIPLGKWVLESTCRQAKLWQQMGLPEVVVAVNLSPKQLEHPDSVAMIAGVLKDTGLEPRFLELEVTENAVMRDPEGMIERLNQFKALGVSLALDDFGTGYSNLVYLRRYPFDKLKIDQSFVRDVATDANDASIVLTIIAMAQRLHLRSVAEGVEGAEQLSFLSNNGCDEIQGYHFSPPCSVEETEQLLKENRHLGRADYPPA